MTRIIYLHGFASGSSSSKARFFRQILGHAGATVLVPDLAQGDFEHLTITGQLAVIDAIVGGEPAALVGSSMGGYLAALYAGRHAAITRLVLLAPAFGFAQRWPERLGAATVEAWRRNGWIEVFHYADNCTRRLSYALLEDGSEYEDYPDFSQPALIFHGLHDDVVPVDYSRQFAAGHGNARLEIMDSDHALLNVLEEIGPKVCRFLLPPSPTLVEASASSPPRAG
jgi:pimeloyl-ACP methyl ester carboxylesterase